MTAHCIIENMPGATLAAIGGDFAIECNIELTADGAAMVHFAPERPTLKSMMQCTILALVTTGDGRSERGTGSNHRWIHPK